MGINNILIRGHLVFLICAFSWSVSAARLEHHGVVVTCEPEAECNTFFVEPGLTFNTYMIVPDGPTGPIPISEFDGINPFNLAVVANPLIYLQNNPAQVLAGVPLSSTLVTDANNRLIGGELELDAATFDNSSITGLISIDAKGDFTAQLRINAFGLTAEFTTTGIGTWNPPANLPPLGPAADLDPGFGTEGYSAWGAPILLLHPDGRILHIASDTTDTAVHIFAQEADGKKQDATGVADVTDGLDIARAAAIQSDGKIVVTGYSDNAGDEDIFVTRFNTDLGLDKSFGTNGFVTFDVSDNVSSRAYSIGIQADDSILLAPGNIASAVSLIKLDANGNIDTGFGTNGEAIDAPPSFSTQLNNQRIPVAVDGEIYLAGIGQNTSSTDDDMAVIRFNPDGTLDNTYGENGIAVFVSPGTDNTNDIALQYDGKVLLAGSTIGTVNADLSVVRFDETGAPDTSFNTTGVVRIDTSGASDSAFGVLVQPDGKIVLGGSGDLNVANDLVAVIARFNADGTPDLDFGSNGVQIDPALCCDGVFIPRAIQDDGRILAFADSAPGSTARFIGDEIITLSADIDISRSEANVELSSDFESETATITGLSDGIVVPILIEKGEYRINGGEYTSKRGLVKNGDTVQFRQIAPATNNVYTETRLRYGGVRNADNYAVSVGARSATLITQTVQGNQASNIAEGSGSIDRLFILSLLSILLLRILYAGISQMRMQSTGKTITPL